MSDILFRNNNSQIVKRLADRSLEADKRRNLFVIITLVFATTLLSILCFYNLAQQAKLENQIRGHYQAVCIESPVELIDSLSKQPEVEQWGICKNIGSARYKDTALNVLYEDENQMNLAGRSAVDGRLPEAENEIMVELPFLQYLNLPEKPGQTVTMNLGDGTKQAYTVTGVLQSENSSRSFSLFVSNEYVIAHSSGNATYDFRFRIANGNEEDMAALKTQIKDFLTRQGVDESKIFYSSNYFDMKDFQSRDNTALYIVGLLLVFACGVVIYSLFYISVAGKLREYGRLKVIGTTPKQLKRIVRRESMYLSLCSIPPGIIIGGILVYVWMPACWQWDENIKSALVVSAVMLLAVLISTRTPIRLAGKVSAIEAVRITPYSIKEGKGISKQLHRRLTATALARMNFVRNRKKTVFTFVSLGLTGIMLMCVATYAVSFDVDSMAAKALGDGGNYMLNLSYSTQEEEQSVLAEDLLNQELYQKLLPLDSVTKITRYNSSYIKVDLPERENARHCFTGLTREQMAHFLPEDFMIAGEADYNAMTRQNGVIIDDATDKLLEKYYGYTPQVGDVLHCTTYGGQDMDVTVLGIAKEPIKTGESASFFLVTDETLMKFYPKTDNFSTVWNIHAEKDSEELRQAIFTAADDGRIEITSRKDLANSLQDSAKTTINGMYMLVAFLFLFALVNLVNTLMTNLLAKQQELGILQAVGMSRKQVMTMLSAECLWYAGLTLLITVMAGGPAGLLICAVFNRVGIFGTLTYHFPWLAAMIFAVVLLVIQGCYSAFAVRFLQKQPLVERIKVLD